jgi:methionyl-tRNA synthetase
MVERYNSDLANDWGNLANRVLNLAVTYRGGQVPAVSAPAAPEEVALRRAAAAALVALDGFGEFRTKQALDGVWRLFAAANAFVEATSPWHLNKDPEQKERLDQVLNAALESLRVGAILISPVMPAGAAEAMGDARLCRESRRWSAGTTGVFGTFPAVTVTKGDPLFRASRCRDPLGGHPRASPSQSAAGAQVMGYTTGRGRACRSAAALPRSGWSGW